MSRGLGALQRQILDSLETARAAAPRYAGSGDSGYGLPPALRGTPQAEGWIWAGRSLLHLVPGLYDLRGTLAYLLERLRHPAEDRAPSGESCAGGSLLACRPVVGGARRSGACVVCAV